MCARRLISEERGMRTVVALFMVGGASILAHVTVWASSQPTFTHGQRIAGAIFYFICMSACLGASYYITFPEETSKTE